jgi:hypothetical protein
MKVIHFFPCKKAYYVKRQDFSKTIFEKFAFSWSRYGAGSGTGTVTCQKSEPELLKSRNRTQNWNPNFSKVGTRIGTATLSTGASSTSSRARGAPGPSGT